MSSPIFDGLQGPIADIAKGIISSSDAAIGAVCGIAWSQIFPGVAALVIGFTFIGMLFNDDLVEGVRSFVGNLIPLLIVAWLIQGGGNCKLVQVKSDIAAISDSMSKAVGGKYGGPSAEVVANVLSELALLLGDFEAQLLNSMKAPPPAGTSPKIPDSGK